MYEDYFGLERPPFKITPDTTACFTKAASAAISSLRWFTRFTAAKASSR